MSALREALEELAGSWGLEPTSPPPIPALSLPEAQAPGADPRSRRAAARALRQEWIGAATALNAALDAAAAAEAERLAPLARALDWLVDPPAEQSLARVLEGLLESEPIERRVGEALGALGAVRSEALLLEGRPAPGEAADAIGSLARVRVSRAAGAVDRWIEEQT